MVLSPTRLATGMRALWDKQKRAAFLSDVNKSIRHKFQSPRETIPVFVFGRQRSGTSMLMFALHLHPQTVVYDEHKDSIVFKDHLIRDFRTVQHVVDSSRAPFCCFKPICDSHRIMDFLKAFPQSRNLWVYRHYKANALSALKKFPHATRAVRLTCTGQVGGGWFQEGVSAETEAILKSVYSDKLTSFDLSCLAWWARNQIFLEHQLANHPRVTLVRYETLVVEGEENLAWIFGRLGLPMHQKCGRFIHQSSVRKPEAPTLAPSVEELCEKTLNALDTYYERTLQDSRISPTADHPLNGSRSLQE